jgi:hypothetical protein
MFLHSRSRLRALPLLALIALLLLPNGAFAQDQGPDQQGAFRSGLAKQAAQFKATPAAQTLDVEALDATIEVVADGLNNPRGLDFGPKGFLFVAEAGFGGDNPNACIPNPEDPASQVCAGATGSVTRINVNDGTQARVATGYPSLAGPDGFAATGLHDVSFANRGSIGVIGLGGDLADREQVANEAFGRQVKHPQSPKWRTTADLTQYEADQNPDGGEIDSNPYSVFALNGAESVAVDAGGNDLLHVNAATGQIHTLAIFPDRMVDAPPFLELPPGTQIPMQAVPTSVVVGPDGAYYVGQLTGFPFPVGGANVYRVAADGSVTVFAEGFTAIIDLAFDAQGNLYVLEFAKNGLLAAEIMGDFTGALIKVDAVTGDRTEIASDGLMAPGGVAIASNGDIYVSNYSIFPGMGQVVKVTP